LLAIQRGVTEARSLDRVGREVTGFVEAQAPRGKQSFVARTDFDGRVIFLCEKDLIGKFVRLKIDSVSHETFQGTLVP
jgi:tRNA A37 methylthiotransferase MiaB